MGIRSRQAALGLGAEELTLEPLELLLERGVTLEELDDLVTAERGGFLVQRHAFFLHDATGDRQEKFHPAAIRTRVC